MPKFRCELSALTRQCMSVVVEAPDQNAAELALGSVYDMTDAGDFDDDHEYWEEGHHYVADEVDPTTPVEFRVHPGGEVVEARTTPGEVDDMVLEYMREHGASDARMHMLLCAFVARTDPQGFAEFLANEKGE